MFEKIDQPFKFRSEQCDEMMYVLIVYPETNEDPERSMSIYAEYVNDKPCYTVTGGVHEVVDSSTQ